MICSKCGHDLPEDAFEFRRDLGRRRSYCRECRREQYRSQNASERHKASCRRYYHVWHQRGGAKGSQGDPELRKALSRLYHRIRTGAVLKPGHCQICGDVLPKKLIQAHLRQHKTDAEPIWCCALCNRAVERMEAKRA